MPRYIDADALLKHEIEADRMGAMLVVGKGYILSAPEVDAVPVVRGEWKLYGNDDDSGMSYWCTACNFHLDEDLFYSGYKNGKWIENRVFKYCSNCGANMEKEKKE